MARKRRLTGEAALRAAYGKSDHAPLLAAWGVDLPDQVLRLALTHRSFANENDHLPNNERLEFLGDAVLGLSVAEQLYRQYPDRSESDISKMRASVVNQYALADVARKLDLGEYILLGRGEMKTDGKDKDSILSDTVEAILGAIYLEHGFAIARATVLRLFQDKIDTALTVGLNMDWKTTVQERLSERGMGHPEYRTESEGPEHAKSFFSTLIVDGKDMTTGKGSTKKEAEHKAARALVHELVSGA